MKRGESEPVTELSWPSCRQLLYQSVATVLAHAGFESAHESVLETLTDLVHEHYLRLTFLLRTAVDREARLGASPFPDVVEQVFHEMGIGSMLALQRFWQVRIKDYHSYMMRVSLKLSYFIACPVQQLRRQIRAEGFLCGTDFTVTIAVMNLLTHKVYMCINPSCNVG